MTENTTRKKKKKKKNKYQRILPVLTLRSLKLPEVPCYIQPNTNTGQFLLAFVSLKIQSLPV